MPAPRNLFTSIFTPGSAYTDEEFEKFERFLPRITNEPNAHYAARLEREGLAFATTSEACRNIGEYKALLSAARDAGLPIAVVTGPMPDQAADREAERAALSPEEALRQARGV